MDNFRHTFQDFVIIKNKIWFSSSVMNGIFCADIDGGYAEFVAVFPEDDLFQPRLYTEIYAYGNCLIFIPHNAKRISIYNILEDSFVQLEPPVSRAGRKTPFVTFQWKHKIYFFSDYALEMTVLNVQNGAIKKVKMPIAPNEYRFAHIKCIVENCAYIVKGNLLISISLDNDSIETRKIAQAEVQLAGIKNEGKDLWLIDRKNQLYSYQIGAEQAKYEAALMDLPWNAPSFLVKDILIIEHVMWLFINRGNCILKFGLSSQEKENIPIETCGSIQTCIEYVYYAGQKSSIHFLVGGEDCHRVLDVKSGVCEKINYETSLTEIAGRYYKYSKQCNRMMRELNAGKGLECLRLCLDMRRLEEKSAATAKNCGKDIWKKIL